MTEIINAKVEFRIVRSEITGICIDSTLVSDTDLHVRLTIQHGNISDQRAFKSQMLRLKLRVFGEGIFSFRPTEIGIHGHIDPEDYYDLIPNLVSCLAETLLPDDQKDKVIKHWDKYQWGNYRRAIERIRLHRMQEFIDTRRFG